MRHNIFGRCSAIVKAAVAIHFFARKHFHAINVKCAQYPCLELIRKKYIFDVLVWQFLFERRGVKNVLLWHKHSEKHLAIFEATRLNGGICSIWKRSFEGAKTIYNLNAADLLFEPNFNDTATLKGIGLDIKAKFSQGIQVCGMIWGAGENPLARYRSKLDRSCWISKGDFQGLTILVVDGGASLDSKWGVGSGYHIETYVTCMNLLDAFPRLRVIFLPKKLVDLPRILGLANWNRLEQLEDNGRCVLVDDQMRKIKSNSSLAEEVDLCIHSHMVAGTVGVECALSGVRTVFLDREYDERNVLNMLPVDTVIFKNWSDLSELLEKSMLNLDEFHNSSIGIWPKEVIDQLDPVGDGLGKLRVYSVLTKIEKLYLSGLDRARILDEVTSDYQDRVKWPEKSLR